MLLLRLLRAVVQAQWPLRLLRPFTGKFDPFSIQRRIDPYPGYAALRASDPVYFSPFLRSWILTRYDDIVAVLKDPRFSVQREGHIPAVLNPLPSLSADLQGFVRSSLLMLDPPNHTRIRSLVSKAFTLRMVERLRPRIQQIADELLDAAEVSGDFDLIRDYAYPLPLIVICEMLGAPVKDRADFQRWSTDLTVLLDPLSGGSLKQANASFSELSGYFRNLFAERRREPRDDLISALVAAEEQGDTLDETELGSICGLILGAGHETTSSLIGNSVLALLRNPGERERLLNDPGLLPSAVDEFLRYDPPVQATDRLALEDLEIRGAKIRKHQFCVLMLGAGNRDPERFEDPDRLDVGRRDNHHLSFSQGGHFCLGAQLARAEGEIAIGTLLRRYPRFSGDPDTKAWRASLALRGLSTLPLSLTGDGIAET